MTKSRAKNYGTEVVSIATKELSKSTTDLIQAVSLRKFVINELKSKPTLINKKLEKLISTWFNQRLTIYTHILIYITNKSTPFYTENEMHDEVEK